MRPFEFIDAASFEEAAKLKADKKTDLIAGGTDILNVYKHAILEEFPEHVVNLKNIPDAAGIGEGEGSITVKAMTKLTAIAESELLKEKAPALAQAAESVATPLIRNLGTIGGNICQDVRCWYYRYAHEAGGRMDCSRKGGNTCYAIQGDNRYHSIFGGLKTHAGSCAQACPAGTDISAYMAKIRKGDWDGAAEIVLRVNPMPMLTSRICPHPCQDHCNQTCYGESVGIHCVERTVGDYILEHTEKFYRMPEKETDKKIAVIGAGPGGLTAAYFLRQQGHDVTVIDAHEKAGGVLYYGIPHYRLPKDLVERFVKALEAMGIKFRMNTTVGKDVAVETIIDSHDMVYLGTGAWKQPILGIHGEELTEFGLDFLVEVNTFLKKAIHGNVLVCGGGNVAMDVALTARRMGAEKVTLVCLEQKDEMPASAEEVARVLEEGIEIFNGWGLKKIVAENGGKVTGLESMRCVHVFDEYGKFAPAYDESEIKSFDADTVILATGQSVDTGFLGEKLGAQLKTERGLFAVDEETYQTGNEKIYAGGDAVTGPNIAIRAIQAGGAAARAMSSKLGYPVETTVSADGFLKYDAEGIERKEAGKLAERQLEARTLTDEDTTSFSMEEAAQEAARCMNCGCYSVNASDISPVLVAFDGTIVTNKKEISAKDFFTTRLKTCDMLDKDELVTAVKIPDMSEYESGYIKDRIRTSIDFAVLSLAYVYRMEGGKFKDIALVLGGAAPVPIRLRELEEFLKGKAPDEKLAETAGELAVKDTIPMSANHYKVNGAKTMISRLIASI